MAEPTYATVTIIGAGDYTNGTYRSPEIDHDNSDPDNPSLRIWLDTDDEQPDGSYRIPPARIRRFTIAAHRIGEGAQFSDGTIAIRWPADAGFEVYVSLDALTGKRPADAITWIDAPSEADRG